MQYEVNDTFEENDDLIEEEINNTAPQSRLSARRLIEIRREEKMLEELLREYD